MAATKKDPRWQTGKAQKHPKLSAAFPAEFSLPAGRASIKKPPREAVRRERAQGPLPQLPRQGAVGEVVEEPLPMPELLSLPPELLGPELEPEPDSDSMLFCRSMQRWVRFWAAVMHSRS